MKYQIFDFDGIGYSKLFVHRDWRVAVLNYIDELEIDNISYVEAHQETDEVFVLLSGSATLFFAETNNNKITRFSKLILEKHKVYNIPAGIYHTHTISPDCKLLIIEQENTDWSNSPKIYLDDESRKLLKETYEGLL